MIDADMHMPDRAEEMRQEFDRSFSRTPLTERSQFEDFLAICLGSDSHVIRLAEIASLLPLHNIVRFPSTAPELLGLTGVTGATVPVFDLGALLGYPTKVKQPRWMVIAAAMPVALAFDVFDGHVRYSCEHNVPAKGAEVTRPQGQEVLCVSGMVRPIVCVASILATIKSRAPLGVPSME